MAADGPGVLVEGANLDAALLGRQPHLLQELGEGLAGRAHPPIRQRPHVRLGRPLGLERAELFHPPLARRRVVSAQPDDPLATLAVDLRLPSLNRSHITRLPHTFCIHRGISYPGKTRAGALAPALTCTFSVGLGRFELPTS